MSLSLLINHFDIAIRKPEDVARLKQLILQLAVRGRLVPQEPDDEPAGHFISIIRKEKTRLPKQGAISRELTHSPLKDDSAPHELPYTWAWTNLQDITLQITDGDHATPPRIDAQAIPWLQQRTSAMGF